MSNCRADKGKRVTLCRFAALGAATPLVGLEGGNDDEDDSSRSSDAQDVTAGYVVSTPGAHFSKVRDDPQLGAGETQYHLRNLVDDGTLEVSRDGDYKRFFPADRFSELKQVILDYPRRDAPCGTLVRLFRDPAAMGSELAARLDVPRVTVGTYAKEFDVMGLLSYEDGYAVRNPETVITLLIRHTDSFGSDAAVFVDDAADLIHFDP